jgi:NADH:ubiquinone oxidoreductase subunit 5 (subunit L)/multisubunit Na+/H+ antiporter MnhA subunit
VYAASLAAYLASPTASAASAARGGFHFDPSSTLAWAVPVLLMIPLVGLVLISVGVRSRRAAANIGVFFVFVTLLDALLVSWARFRSGAPYSVTYQWINIPVSTSGLQQFQGFGIDLSFRLDHYSLAAIILVLLIFLACLLWHRVSGRTEPGPIRYQSLVMVLLLAALGVLVSGDLVAQFAFWTVAGAASYLLLSHRWGTEVCARESRVALALPFLGDVALLCGVGLLYSRFGLTDLTKIAPVVHTTPGVGLKALTAAAVLVFAAVLVRSALWPFTAWQTGTLEEPPSLVALVAGVWPVLAGLVLLRYLPLFGWAGPQAQSIAQASLVVAGLIGGVLALLTMDLRRALLLASGGALAAALLGFLYRSSPLVAAGFTGVLAIAAGRAGMLLSAGSVVAVLRTSDMRLMGAGLDRMRGTMIALGGSGLAVALGACAAAAQRSYWLAVAATVVGLALASFGIFRGFVVAAVGRLPRRRAFEPPRGPWAPAAAVRAGLLLAGAGLLAVGLSFFTGWLGFLSTGKHPVTVGTDVLWLLPPLAGAVGAELVFGLRRRSATQLLVRLTALYGLGWSLVAAAYVRFIDRPGSRIISGIADVAVPAAESGVGRALVTAGALAGRPLPWVATLVAAAVVLAVVLGLVSPGESR